MFRWLRCRSSGQSAKPLAARRTEAFRSCKQVFSLHFAVHAIATQLANRLHDQRLSAKRQHDDGCTDYIGASSRPGPDLTWESHVRRGETNRGEHSRLCRCEGERETEVHSDLRLTPANGRMVAQYQGASSCKRVWCASSQ